MKNEEMALLFSEATPYIQKYHGKTVVIITHNSAITQMADRVVRVKNGTVVSVQTNDHPKSVEEIDW